MNIHVPFLVCTTIACFAAAPRPAPVPNGSFEEGEPAPAPPGWHAYGKRTNALKIVRAAPGAHGQRALLLFDDDPTAEVGIYIDLPARSNETYEASVAVRKVPDASPAGAYLQMRFLPSNRLVQTPLAAKRSERFERVAVRGAAPAGTRTIRIYLYTHAEPTPKVIVDDVRVLASVPPPPPPPSPPPKPVAPVYRKLKNLYLDTIIAADGRPEAVIVAPANGLYDSVASALQQRIRKLTGVTVPIVSDDGPAAAVPFQSNLIVLGNRTTNKTIGELYNRFYTLLDLRYPGRGGSVVRTLHNPFGNGRNAVLVGGSDADGVAAAARTLESLFEHAPHGPGRLALGPAARIRLGADAQPPEGDPRSWPIWEASAGYGDTGYFGWNSLSKLMAAYYMTGRAEYAREFLRLAFPDAKAKKEIAQIDGERIENKDAPLSGPYHYNTHMMILFWDLIEESPVFSDADRLRITNALARQIEHDDYARRAVYNLQAPSAAVGSRHHQWAAVSLYCLGRYFQKDYPNPVWEQCIRGAQYEFASLHDYAWVGGESDNLFWYDTGIAPILTYLLLSGDRTPVENGVMQTLLRGLEILYSGRPGHWSLRYASLGFLHKAAFLTHDARWLWYRQQTGVDARVFRLGQSYWPGPDQRPVPPTDLAGKWSIFRMSEPKWRKRRSGLPFEQSFEFGSFRDRVGPDGDFILIDGFNGASRNPYHCFAILDLRLGGVPLLDGYRNQVQTRLDGLVEPRVPMDAALEHCDALGDAAVCTARVPNMAFCDWRRRLLQRIGRFTLIVDEITPRETTENLDVDILWEFARGVVRTSPAPGLLRLRVPQAASLPPGWTRIRTLDCACRTNLEEPRSLVRLTSLGITLLRSSHDGDWIEMPFTLDKPVTGEWFVELLNYRDRGKVRFLLDGKPMGAPFDHRSATATPARASLGRRTLAAGPHALRVITERAGDSNKCYVGLVGLLCRADSAPPLPQSVYDLCLSEPAKTRARSAVAGMFWHGAVQKGRRICLFSLIASSGNNEPACNRVSDNAAVLSTPEPALAVAGAYDETRADLAVIGPDWMYGRGVRALGIGAPLLRCTVPTDLVWDLAAGRMDVAADRPTVLHIARASDAKSLRLDGKPQSWGPVDKHGLAELPIPSGRHVITGIAVPPVLRRRMRSSIVDNLLPQALEQRRAAARRITRPAQIDARPMAPAVRMKIPGAVADAVIIPRDDGPSYVAAAENRSIHFFTLDGRPVRTLTVSGRIRMLHWWREPGLLLAGCDNEEVVAFGLDGARRWTFVSKMDPAVFRAAKTYWFKSALPGIHGLDTGKFLDNRTQCFVGSACTLEILDERGRLIKRMPLFWGKNSLFRIIDGPDGTRNLLVAREYSGTHGVSIVNSKGLRFLGKSFTAVPPGHTYVGGWSSLNRYHLFYTDLDGDGRKEIVSEINGTWNRVTVWTPNGKALYDASFGPGERIPARNVRDLCVTDLDDDGKQEIIAALSRGLIVTLDCRCRRKWTVRLPSPPEVMCDIPPPPSGSRDSTRLVVAGDSGAILGLDGKGRFTVKGRVQGRPRVLLRAGERRIVVGTSTGELAVFEL